MESDDLQLDDLIRMVRNDATSEPLDELADSVLLAGRLDELADELVGHFVDHARDTGASWADIGDVLGVSRQAAQQRYVPDRPKKGRKRGFFLTRFDESAREAVRRAERHARDARSRQVGTEHLVLGLIDDEDSRAARGLVALGASLDAIRAAATAAIATQAASRGKGHIPFSSGSKKVLELAYREALRAGDDAIGTEHILLGLLRDRWTPGRRIVAVQGVTRGDFERWLRS